MIRINRTEPQSLLEAVEKTIGSVFLLLPDTSQIDLKHDETARRMLLHGAAGNGPFRLSISERSDVPVFVEYLSGLRCS